MDTTNAVADIDSGLAVVLKRLIQSQKHNGLPSAGPEAQKPPMGFKPTELGEGSTEEAYASGALS